MIALETRIGQLKIEYSILRSQYKKNQSNELKEELDAKQTELSKAKLDLNLLRSTLKQAQKQAQKEEILFLEEQRKQTLFECCQYVTDLFHINTIPELYDKTNPWKNVRYWYENRWTDLSKNAKLFAVFKKWMEDHQYISDKHDLLELCDFLQKQRSKPLTEWNLYLLFKNGLFVNQHFVPNLPEYFTFREYNFNLILLEELTQRIDLSFLTHHFSQVTEDWEEICWWVGNCIRHQPMEYFLIFLGQPSGGKSPWAKAIKNIFGEVGTDGFDELGDKGGLATSWDKNINIDFDANIAYLPSKTISKIKQIFGDDPMQNIRLLFQNSFQFKVSPYLLVLINTMPKIPQGVNTSALFKRTYICEFNRKLEDNKGFKKMLDEPEFIDLFGSFCYWFSFREKLSNGAYADRRYKRLDDFVLHTEQQWMDNAYPVRKAILYLLRRSTDPEDEIYQRTISLVVQDWFKDPKLNTLNLSIPTNLIGDITEAITLLGGDKCQREKKKAYEGVYWTDNGKIMYNKYLISSPTSDPMTASSTTIQQESIEMTKQILKIIEGYQTPFLFEDIYTSLSSTYTPDQIRIILLKCVEKNIIYKTKNPFEYQLTKGLKFTGFDDIA